jgi:hypothetical protein
MNYLERNKFRWQLHSQLWFIPLTAGMNTTLIAARKKKRLWNVTCSVKNNVTYYSTSVMVDCQSIGENPIV